MMKAYSKGGSQGVEGKKKKPILWISVSFRFLLLKWEIGEVKETHLWQWSLGTCIN